MVSIVIVSHSAKLAEGVKELAEQMVQGQVDMAIAGGIDDPENPIGTDALKVMEAINAVYSEDGVLVMMDLGSALLSAEMALEFLLPEQQSNVYLVAAPLVEGVMAAAVQAAAGGSIEQVITESLGALAAKEMQLQPLISTPPSTLPPSQAPQLEGEAQELFLTVHNRLGLHARPAALFVRTVTRFEANITVDKGEQRASAKSINQVATLGVRQGDQIRIMAAGPDAAEALAALQALADDNFGETDEDIIEISVPLEPLKKQEIEGELTGIAASPGIAIGPVYQYRPTLPEVTTREVENPAEEWLRLQEAISRARDEIKSLHTLAIAQVGSKEAAIFEAHLLFLEDPALVDESRALILNQKINAEAAWQQIIEYTAEMYRDLEDAYMQARAGDVMDVGRRVLQELLGLERPKLDLSEPAILLTEDLTPSDTAQLNPEKVLGICTELGGFTSHSAILARALGIPAIVGLGPNLNNLAAGQIVALDGHTGNLWTNPDPQQIRALEKEREIWLAQQMKAKAAGQATAVTQDGQRLEIAANIGGPQDAEIALQYGAEGVGLFRTEFLFLDRQTAPSEEEQYLAYRQVAEVMGQNPLIIRTLDIGGDKPLPYLNLALEENPFLGWRGIRFCLDQPEIFKPQLRAILRAGHGHDIKLMFPMVGAKEEVIAAKAILAEIKAELAAEGLPHNDSLDVGIMIEVPSAVTIADQLADEVDFFSIGTNDLTQYVMAADRGNSRVATLADALQPAVLRMVKQTVDAAHAAGKWVGMCGELAGNELATPILVGLGLDELSMNAPAIPAVKEVIRNLTLTRAKEIAAHVLNCDSAEAVRRYLIDQKTQAIGQV